MGKYFIIFTVGLFLFIVTQSDARCTRMTIFDKADGTGKQTNIRVIGRRCHSWPMRDAWNREAMALLMTRGLGCIKVASTNNCGGQGQCVCQSNHHMISTWNTTATGATRTLSFGDCGATPKPPVGATVQIFTGSSFTSTTLTVQIHEGQCETFRNDQTWKDMVGSLRVTGGCVEYFNGPGCTGDEGTLWKEDKTYTSEFEESSNEVATLDNRFNNRVRSFRSCKIPTVPPATGNVF